MYTLGVLFGVQEIYTLLQDHDIQTSMPSGAVNPVRLAQSSPLWEARFAKEEDQFRKKEEQLRVKDSGRDREIGVRVYRGERGLGFWGPGFAALNSNSP